MNSASLLVALGMVLLVGLIIFSLLMAIVTGMAGGGHIGMIVLQGFWDLGGALVLGMILGIPAAYLSGRLDPGEPSSLEAVSIVLLCGGLAMMLEVSFLLAAMALGAVMANLARHHKRPFHEIERIEWLVMTLFFVLAGASLELHSLLDLGKIGFAYVILRVLSRLMGGWLGARIGHGNAPTRRWMGLALMPQAGVALGMALVTTRHFPDLATTILPLVIGSTALFEVLGPIATRLALIRVQEAGLSVKGIPRRTVGQGSA